MSRIVNLYTTKTKEISLSEAYKTFIEFKRAQKCAEYTIRDYENTFNKFIPISNNSLEYEILVTDVLKFLNSIPETSPAVYNIPYGNLNAFFNWCFKQDYLDINPIQKLGLKKRRDDGNIRCVSIDSVKKFINAINIKTYVGLRDYTITLLILDTGIRPKEALTLKGENLDAGGSRIILTKDLSKTRKKRILPLSQIVLENIKMLLSIKPNDWEDRIFSTYDGGYMDCRILDKRFEIYSRQSGVKITPYQLRHTFATEFHKASRDIFTLQRLMGHSDIRMTKRYVFVDDEQIVNSHTLSTPLNRVVQRNSRVTRILR
ncbi:tyrosine-type recombinase/integrase [Aminipila sp.]|uniref:tyrosine-type recombinase/integrase n=1 Tax=Aminipila sp. TaxID=2060095 RepID=UPI002899DEE9|nr:site-specific integrase [Aminipila sp.]